MHLVTRQLFISNIALFAGSCLPVLAASNSTYVSLAYIARLYSMGTSSSGKKIVMKNKWNTLEVETNGRRAWINGVMLWLHHPCRKSGRNWSIREVDFKKGIDPVLRAYAHVPTRTPRLVMLDPGHGGKDTGALSPRKVYEKLAVLDISRRVKTHLTARKIPCRLTRDTDTFIALSERSSIAAKAGADLFVSIHADGAEDPSAHGVETFVMTAAGCDSSNYYGQGGDKSEKRGNQYDAANAVLGFSIQSNLLKTSKRSDRGLRRARFAVLKNAPCPAALVECGFLTNPEEEALMIDSNYREAVARGISNGIIGYITYVNRAGK